MKKIFILILLIASFQINAQGVSKSKNNSLFFNFNYYYRYFKIENSLYGWKSSIYMLNYNRSFIHKKNFIIKGELGLGLFSNSLGELAGIISNLNTNLYIKNYINRKQHNIYYGLGIDFTPFYLDTYFVLPIGYQYNILPELSIICSLNQTLWYQFYGNDSFGRVITKNWIWNSDKNILWLMVGFGYNF